jgi:hypothetical protein
MSDIASQVSESKAPADQDSKLKKIVADFFNKIEMETANRILAKKRQAEAEKEK